MGSFLHRFVRFRTRSPAIGAPTPTALGFHCGLLRTALSAYLLSFAANIERFVSALVVGFAWVCGLGNVLDGLFREAVPPICCRPPYRGASSPPWTATG